MVVCPKRKLVASANKQTMSMMGNSSLQHADNAIISASIVDRAVSVCNLDCQNTGHSAKVIMNPVRLFAQAGSVCDLCDHTSLQSQRQDKHQVC